MKKYFLLVTIILFLAVLVFTGLVKLSLIKTPQKIDVSRFINFDPGIAVSAPKSGQVISSPLIIQGQINGFGWTGFEGQVGTVTLVDGDGNVLTQTFLPAKTDWMTLPVSFEATLNFDAPKSKSGKLIFRNENASGETSRNKVFELPVSF